MFEVEPDHEQRRDDADRSECRLLLESVREVGGIVSVSAEMVIGR